VAANSKPVRLALWVRRVRKERLVSRVLMVSLARQDQLVLLELLVRKV